MRIHLPSIVLQIKYEPSLAERALLLEEQPASCIKSARRRSPLFSKSSVVHDSDYTMLYTL
jgi:hypothetical protein